MKPRYLKWGQRQIMEWSRRNFGWTSPMDIAIRGNKEMSELLGALNNKDSEINAIAEEAADVCIFLLQICESIDRDLLGMVDAKMDINEKRSWTKTSDGSFRHVEEKPKPKHAHIIQKEKFLKEHSFAEREFCTVCGYRDENLMLDCPGF